MKKLLSYLAVRPTKGDFGIEIEVEGAGLVPIMTDCWKSEVDNSLRGGLEYVMAKPVPLKDVVPSILLLKKHFEQHKSKTVFSFRTSVHVHVNVQQLSMSELINFIYTYLLLEEPLMNLCGDSRKGNRFCLRSQDAEFMLDAMKVLATNGFGGFRYLDANTLRYSAINVEAVKKYGSLEFRAMEGNLDEYRIGTWCHVLDAMRAFACSREGPDDIYNQFIESNPEDFMRLVLGDLANHLTYPDMVKDIQRSFSLSLEIPFAYVDGYKKKAHLEKSSEEPNPADLVAAAEGMKIKRVAFGDDWAAIAGAAPAEVRIIDDIVDDIPPRPIGDRIRPAPRVRKVVARVAPAEEEEDDDAN